MYTVGCYSAAKGTSSFRAEGGGSGEGCDSFMVEVNGKACVLGVFDGHGKAGKRSSMACMERVRSGVAEELSKKGSDGIEKRILDRVVSEVVESDDRSGDTMSGTTVAVVVHTGCGNVASVHVGDSSCAVFGMDGRKLFETRPHDLSNGREIRRLSEAGYVHFGGNRLGGFISTTRSVGVRKLKNKRLGGMLVSEPEVNMVKVRDRKFYVLVMSDGMSKRMDDEEVFRAVSTGKFPDLEWTDDATLIHALVEP